ncbi:MAG: hypothetical protein WCO13_00745 [Bacteroidota bacterium]
MYKEILPEHQQNIINLVENMQIQLDSYKKKPNAKASFIHIKTNEIFIIRQFLNVLENSLIEFQNMRVEQGRAKYLQGMQADNEREKSLTKNLYHAGSFIKEYLAALQAAQQRRAENGR